MAALSDRQLDSKLVAHVIRHCWRLEEWGIVGSGPFRPKLSGSGYMRPFVRFLATLSPGQRQGALSPAGLPFEQLSPAQQEALASLWMRHGSLLRHDADPRLLGGLRLHVDYAPVGSYLWFPNDVFTGEPVQENREWPVVFEATAEAALAAARRFNPAAEPGEIRPSQGVLSFTFTASNRETWKVQ
jgi:hypothetical protein